MSGKVKQAQISVKEFPTCVRLRKGMYISNINQMVTEIVDNSVDEHSAGYCKNIAVACNTNGSYTIQDDGRGIPITPHPDYPDKSQVEIAFTTLHGGGKFADEGGYEDVKTGGMNGVGGSCVQALSDYMDIQVATDGKKYQIDFAKGYVTEKVRCIEKETDEQGTTVTFHPDPEIWKNDAPFNYASLKTRIKQLAYLNPGLNMYLFENENVEEPEVFSFDDGLKSYIEELIPKGKEKITDTIYVSKSENNVDVQLALAYTNTYNESLYCFCNNMATTSNGDHLTGFIMGLNSSIKKYIESYNIKLDFKSEDIKEGLIGIVSVKVANPNFEGQAKTKLVMKSVKDAVKKITEDILIEYLDKNPDAAKAIINKIETAAKARIAAQKARELTRSKKNNQQLDSKYASKLADCTSKDPNECEIYIVEGDSAGGSAKQARNRKTQAIIAPFGKPNNVEKETKEKVLASDKLKMFSSAMKCGVGEDFDIKNIRYGRVIIMADADVDGYHIRTLWTTYIYRYMRPLLEEGRIYYAVAPLYKMTYGKKVEYAYTDAEKEKILAEKGKADNIQRYKGLGEMNPEQLWETTMNPENRKLIQVTLNDAEKAEEVIKLCMGEVVAPRTEWIMENGVYNKED
jgi:DNA gyrase subunit B